MGWNRLEQYGCASAQTIAFFMEGAPSTLHTILSGRGLGSSMGAEIMRVGVSVGWVDIDVEETA